MKAEFKERAIPFIQVDPETKGTIIRIFRIHNK
jgi:hypothetical protein